jgi:hypothetical protein
MSPSVRRYGKKQNSKVVRNLCIQPRNWQWALQQPGGASKCIDYLVDNARKQDERKGLRKKYAAAVAEVERLTRMLNKNGISTDGATPET